MKIPKGVLCSGCGKQDWCLASEKFDSFLCMRVQSDRPIPFKDGSVGYIHQSVSGTVVAPRIKREEKHHSELTKMMPEIYANILANTKEEWLEKLARQLGVTVESVKAIGAAWSTKKQAWAFPMRDGQQNIVGIRFRSVEGKKWAFTGSRNALFIPKDDYFAHTIYLVEGPTDVCAGVTLGLKIIGRPSCSAGMPDILNFIKTNKVKRVVQIADNDTVKVSPSGVRSYPGTESAEVTAQHLPVSSLTITLPVKDLRAFVKFNGTATMLQALEKSMTWRNPSH